MGKKGKRTKWQALPMEEDTTVSTNCNGGASASPVVAGGYKKFRPFSTYNGELNHGGGRFNIPNFASVTVLKFPGSRNSRPTVAKFT